MGSVPAAHVDVALWVAADLLLVNFLVLQFTRTSVVFPRPCTRRSLPKVVCLLSRPCTHRLPPNTRSDQQEVLHTQRIRELAQIMTQATALVTLPVSQTMIAAMTTQLSAVQVAH